MKPLKNAKKYFEVDKWFLDAYGCLAEINVMLTQATSKLLSSYWEGRKDVAEKFVNFINEALTKYRNVLDQIEAKVKLVEEEF